MDPLFFEDFPVDAPRHTSRARPGVVYVPAEGQVPMTGRDRYIRNLQNLLVANPDDADTRRRYYEMLGARCVEEHQEPLTQVIHASLHVFTPKPVRPTLRARLAAWLRGLAFYLERP